MEENEFSHQLNTILEETSPKAAFNRLCGLYWQATPEQRVTIRSNWDFNRAWEVPLTNYLACEVQEDLPRQERIRAALTYQSIENARSDYRDNLVSICLIYHAAISIEMGVEELFKEVASMSSPEVSELILGFLRREPEQKSLEVFLYREEVTTNGIVYVEEPWEYRPPKTSDKLKRFFEDQMPALSALMRRAVDRTRGHNPRDEA